jgi:hypothetical protein
MLMEYVCEYNSAYWGGGVDVNWFSMQREACGEALDFQVLLLTP